MNPTSVVRHHHRIEVGWKDGRRASSPRPVAAAWRQALSREGQPPGSQAPEQVYCSLSSLPNSTSWWELSSAPATGALFRGLGGRCRRAPIT